MGLGGWPPNTTSGITKKFVFTEMLNKLYYVLFSY